MLARTSGLPVSFELLPAGFHAEREKLSRLSTVSPPSSVHQSPAAGSVCLVTGNDKAGAVKTARLSSDARNWINMPGNCKEHSVFCVRSSGAGGGPPGT